MPCCHSSGSVSNCRGAVSGVLLGGGSHECTKVRAAVTSQAQYVASEQTKLLRRFRLACPQTRDLFEGTLLDRNNTALSFGTKLCLKVLLVHLKCAKSEVRRPAKSNERKRSWRRKEFQRNCKRQLRWRRMRCRTQVISLVTFITIASFTNVAFNSASPTASSPAISSNSTVSPMLSPRPHSGAHRYHNYAPVPRT